MIIVITALIIMHQVRNNSRLKKVEDKLINKILTKLKIIFTSLVGLWGSVGLSLATGDDNYCHTKSELVSTLSIFVFGMKLKLSFFLFLLQFSSSVCDFMVNVVWFICPPQTSISSAGNYVFVARFVSWGYLDSGWV